jgi:hypothetical protein
MKKALAVSLVALALSAPAYATYVVVLKGGQTFSAKAKWTVVKGKAIVHLENGQTLQLDPNDIDVAKSEQLTKSGLRDANIIDLDPNMPSKGKAPAGPSLGSSIKLRNVSSAPTTAANAAAAAAAPTGPVLGFDVIDKFDRSYENVGIFEKKLTGTGMATLRADLTADNEDKVFNAISATSFLIMNIKEAKIEAVELYMKTTMGGSAGRFKMTREDATALEAIPANAREKALHDYYIRKVLF